jgi:hypothetical protein
MAFQVSPGINVSEIDLTTIVPGVATSLGGIATYFEWGPGNEVTLVDTPKTMRELFGDVKEFNAANYLTCINFLGYSRGLQVVRILGTAARNANAGGLSDAAQYVPNDSSDLSSLTGGFYARYAGEKGNSIGIAISATGATAWEFWDVFGRAPSSTDNLVALAGEETNDQIHLVVYDALGKFTGIRGEVLERYESVSLHPEARNNDGTSLYFKNVVNEKSKYIKCSGSVDLYDLDTRFPPTVFGSQDDGINVTRDNYKFTFGSSGYINGISLSAGAGQTSGSKFGIPGEGYELFTDTERLDVNLLLGGDSESSSDLQALKRIAEDRQDCVAFVSCDVGRNGEGLQQNDSQKAQKCIDFKNKVGSSSYVFIDSGYKKQFDLYNQVYRWVPLNGDIAGIVARTEFNTDAWFSPGGYNRGIIRSAEALAFNPNRTFRDKIYPKGINPVIFERDTGYLLLGDRTALSKPSAFDRINVRRLFIVLQKAIKRASKFSLFEFNDNFTRGQFTSLVTPFLADVRSRRGIIDYKVVCDDTNNTPERIDRNEFWADIYIKPNRSINFIQLNFIATRTGGDFTVIGA